MQEMVVVLSLIASFVGSPTALAQTGEPPPTETAPPPEAAPPAEPAPTPPVAPAAPVAPRAGPPTALALPAALGTWYVLGNQDAASRLRVGGLIQLDGRSYFED